MISVAKIIEQVRIDERDINEVQFSDWDIENCLNKALRLMAYQLAMMNTDFCERTISLTKEQVKDGYVLPDDFVTVATIVATESASAYRLHPTTLTISTMAETDYMIMQGKLYAKVDVELKYKAMLPEVHNGDVIDVPAPFFDMIEAITRLILNNEPKDALLSEIAELAKAIVPSRRYATARTSLPFRV